MGNSCSSVKLYLEKKVAGSITKRTLAKDAKPSVEPKNVTAVASTSGLDATGQALSLNEIEHGVIRTRWDEPRVHACVNCASRSCPDLLGQAYRGDDRLDYQLTAQFKLWLRDETKGLTFDETRKPMLSRIFLWYAGDFETRGGSPAYAAQYAPAGAARDALATTAPSYFEYDWNLNTQ